METAAFEDKFIAFIDIIGFKNMVEGAEQGTGRSTKEIFAIQSELEGKKSKEFILESGPRVCPNSQRVQKDLSFEITQISDCAIISVEVSPAGAINLIDHCWGRVLMLLTQGILVRGYITRGTIIHRGNRLLGTGYQNAYQQEAVVTAFKKEVDEKGTPFVEIDPAVVSYISKANDACVNGVFNRLVKSDGNVTAIYPFKSLSHSFSIGGFGSSEFDPEKEKSSNDSLRSVIINLIEQVNKYVHPENELAVRKIRHYVAALELQLQECDTTDEMIDRLTSPFPSGT